MDRSGCSSLAAASATFGAASRLDSLGIAAVNAEQASPEALRAHVKSEIDTLGGLLVKAGVKAN